MTHTFEVEVDNKIYESEVDIVCIYSDWEHGYDGEICPTGDVIDWEIDIIDLTLPPKVTQKIKEVATEWAKEYMKY
jgi:hypothetical protein